MSSERGIKELKQWLGDNHLSRNDTKTKLICFDLYRFHLTHINNILVHDYNCKGSNCISISNFERCDNAKILA